jgi:hypothetical protein
MAATIWVSGSSLPLLLLVGSTVPRQALLDRMQSIMTNYLPIALIFLC